MVNSKVRNDDALGWRLKLGVIVPATNTIVEPEFHSMAPAGVTCHPGRFPLKDVRISSNDDFERLVADIHANLDRAVDEAAAAGPVGSGFAAKLEVAAETGDPRRRAAAFHPGDQIEVVAGFGHQHRRLDIGRRVYWSHGWLVQRRLRGRRRGGDYRRRRHQ